MSPLVNTPKEAESVKDSAHTMPAAEWLPTNLNQSIQRTSGQMDAEDLCKTLQANRSKTQSYERMVKLCLLFTRT